MGTTEKPGHAPLRSPRGDRCRLLLRVTCAGLAPWLGMAAPARAEPACGAEGASLAAVASVSDDLEIALVDGRVLRLAGLDVPRRADGPAPRRAAREALVAWLARGPLLMRPLAGAPDRWGRIPALLFHDGDGESALDELLAAGLVRFRPESTLDGCAEAPLTREAAAREARRGLWADPRNGPVRADDAEGLAARSGGLALVEGILQVHAGRDGTLYLTLGRDRWGFAAILGRRDAARFMAAGLDPRDYVGTPVRIRGDLDDRFGPRLRLTLPEQFESLEPGALDADASGPAATR